ncbi:hypothetical protein ACFLYZ_00430 [Thermodesulfobacteriota bacterium]
MRLDKNPMFRKAIVPWYDSETACFIVIVLMAFIFMFGFAGTSVAHENAAYQEYIWVPVLLMVMSGWVIVSTTIRLIKRYAYRYSK